MADSRSATRSASNVSTEWWSITTLFFLLPPCPTPTSNTSHQSFPGSPQRCLWDLVREVV